MSRLNAESRATLRAAGVSQAEWARRNHYANGRWGGDACGCPDDRCISFHHDEQDECGCLQALLSDTSRLQVTPEVHAAGWPMTETVTREQQLAERLAELRAKHPMLGDSYWEGMERIQRLQWQVDDLTNGVAELAGRYGYHAGQNPDNTLLAQLVTDLRALLGLAADGGEGRD